jgi:hypothetical protein
LIDKDGTASMEMYLSVGVSTLVALMAAHRADAGRDRMISAIFDREGIARAERNLDSDTPPAVEPDLSLW